MMNRLFVTSLKSIGLVAAGDNPESEVVIFKSHIDTDPRAKAAIARWDETVEEWRARNKRRLAAASDVLADLSKRTDRLTTKRTNQRSSRLATIAERNNPMMTEKETPQELNELVKARLDAYAAREQFEGEIQGRYGFLSTPRQEMIIKIRSKWWNTPDGMAVRDLLRERGGDPADDLTTIAKSHGEAYAAIGRLDG